MNNLPNPEKTTWTIDEVISLAKSSWQRGEFQKVEAICNDLLRQAQGQEANVFWVVGLISYEIAQPNMAIKYLSESLHREATPEKYRIMATVYFDFKQFESAFSCLCKALELQPSVEEGEKIFLLLLNCREYVQDFLAWRELGLFYLKAKCHSHYKAFYCFRKSLDIQPDSAEVYSLLVEAAKGNGEFYAQFSNQPVDKEDTQGLAALYFTALLGTPQHPTVSYHPQEPSWAELGGIYFYIQQYEMAFYFLRRAIVAAPESVELFTMLLSCGEQLNDFEHWKELGIFYSKIVLYWQALTCLRKALNIRYSTELDALLKNLAKERDFAVSGTFIEVSDHIPILSILMMTYNHERFIARAVESVLEQQTDFPCKFYVIEDYSIDRTREILQHYKTLYPNKINLVLHQSNLGVRHSWFEGYELLTGKYVTYLDGDDYWMSPKKLQKQVDFLETHADFIACAHNTILIYEDKSQPDELMIKGVIKPEHSIIDLIDGTSFFHINSLVYRNVFRGKLPMYFRHEAAADYFLSMTYAQHGNIKYFEEVMSAYRIHSQGIWCSFSQAERDMKNLDGLVVYNRLLGYKYNSLFAKRIWWGCWSVLKQYGLENPKIKEKYTALANSIEFEHRNLDSDEREKNRQVYNSFLPASFLK